MTSVVTTEMSIMPLPMVLATWVPRTKAATKLKNAAQATASRGEYSRAMFVELFPDPLSPSFLSPSNLLNVLRQTSLIFLMASGLTLVILTAVSPALARFGLGRLPGDIVVRFGPTSIAGRGLTVVVETRDRADAKGLKRVTADLEGAMRQRHATAGVYVGSSTA